MAGYDFSTINPDDFEKLVCDLLNARAKAIDSTVTLRTFKEGKDRGIDLLYSIPENDHQIVGQVKHFIKSDYKALKRHLIASEVSKVIKLNPKYYIFATSIPLSVDNKKEIRDLFSPYIHSINDVYGKDDLNDILRENPTIEAVHFKLWFSSTTALTRIMKYKHAGRTNEFQENILKKKLRLFVETTEVIKAQQILSRNKFLIITGEPGVGKTTLSDILVYKHLAQGFDISIVYDNIREIEEVYRDDDSKQLFYFDDFLGHTQAEIKKSKEAETFLLKQISRIENATNKYLILNTRKFILSTMMEESERFRQYKPLRGESKLELTAYSFSAKRKMLDNHLLESELPDQLKKVVKEHAFTICEHQNFSPRHLDFFTNHRHVGDFNELELKNFIIQNLANPKNIWDHAYKQQISSKERIFINTLYSFKGKCDYETLMNAFESRVSYEATNNNFIKNPEDFQTCLKNLNGGFIDIYRVKNIQKISFINPSLEDYLHNIIKENVQEQENILRPALEINQWFNIFEPFNNNSNAVPASLLFYFEDNFQKTATYYFADYYRYAAAVFISYFKPTSEKFVIRQLENITNWSAILQSDLDDYHSAFLSSMVGKSGYYETLCRFPFIYFARILYDIDDILELVYTIPLLKYYNFNFIYQVSALNRESENYDLANDIIEHFEELLVVEVEYQYNQLLRNTEIDEHLYLLEKIDNAYDLVKTHINPKINVDYSHLKNRDWNSVAQENLIQETIFGTKSDPENYHDSDYFDYQYDSEYDYEKEKFNSRLLSSRSEVSDPDDDYPF